MLYPISSRLVFRLIVLVLACFSLGQISGCSGKGKKNKGNEADQEPDPIIKPNDAITVSKKDTANSSVTLDWVQFRGPGFKATTDVTAIPVQWGESEIAWKAKLTGAGSSSPIVFGDRVFITSFDGYGMSAENRGKLSELKHYVSCYDRNSGDLIWQRTIQGSPASPKLSENLLNHGFASSTPYCDGESLFTFFGISGVYAFDLDGKLLWQQDVGTRSDNFGSSTSLSVHEDLLYVNASIEAKSLFALDKKTGNGVWQFDDVEKSWTTPVVAKNAEGNHELILSQKKWVHGLDPKTGKEIWRCKGVQDYVVPTPLVIDGICYINGGRSKETMAIKLGGKGDVTETHQLWSKSLGSNVSSAVFRDGLLFICSDNGIMQVIDAENGKRLKQKRISKIKRIISSPSLVGKYIFLPTLNRGIAVFTADEKCELVGQNVFADDDNELRASIAFTADQMFVRNSEFLYCLAVDAEKKKSSLEPVQYTDADVIQPMKKFDYDAKSKKHKQYLNYLQTDAQQLAELMLRPYKSVITPEQTEASIKIVAELHEPFLKLRKRHIDVCWQRLQRKIDDEKFGEEVAKIETEAIDHNRVIRAKIKGMFSEEQMQKHIEEEQANKKKK